MYGKYIWNSGATQSQMLDDVCKMITGTAIASLSASCDKTNSAILANTATNNWAVYDSAASASSQVLRSLCADGTSYKYMELSYSGSTLTAALWESWNSGTHAGTNKAYGKAGATPVYATPTAHDAFATTGGTLYFFADERFLHIMNAAGSYGALVAEFSRDAAFLTSSYPCSVIAPVGTVVATMYQGQPTPVATTTVGVCRVKSAAAAGDIVYNATSSTYAEAMNGITPIGCPGTGSSASFLGYPGSTANIGGAAERLSAGETPYYSVWPLFVFARTGANGIPTSYLGKVASLKVFGSSVTCNPLDEIAVDGVTHVIVRGQSNSIVIPKA